MQFEPTIVPLSCAECGADLTVPPSGNVIRCPYCKREHLFVAPPATRRPDQAQQYAPGTAVLVEWGGRWWYATVISVLGDGRWKIHYDGWSSRWDETVVASRIAPRGSSLPLARGSAGAIGAVIAIVGIVVMGGVLMAVRARPREAVSARSSSATPTGLPIDARTIVVPGERVEVLDHARWYSSHVLSLRADGQIQVHYDGWASSYDEFIPRDRVRVFGPHNVSGTASEPPPVSPTGGDPPGTAIASDAPLQQGDAVWALSQRQWYRAEIVRAARESRYEVRYIGYGAEWNETLGLDRLRARAE